MSSFGQDNSSHQNLLGPDEDGVPTLWDSFLKGYSLAGGGSIECCYSTSTSSSSYTMILTNISCEPHSGSGHCIGTRLVWDHSSAQAGQPAPEYQWLSYAQVLARIRHISAGFIELLRPSGHSDSQDVLDRPRVALWCPSSPCWVQLVSFFFYSSYWSLD
jgi:hypothetical protein